MKITVIVPLYHGKKYINNIVEQINKNAGNVEKEIELILYNDSPEEEIHTEEIPQNTYKVQLVQPGYNSGIHGARVNALGYASGEYVIFLDQDDRIADDYLAKQLNEIEGQKADVVICRAVENNKMYYTKTMVFEEVITKEFALNNFNAIISPGQAVIRKEAIPSIWKNNILKNNGADDYFLWLAMWAQNKKFALNQDILFEHVMTGRNTSDNVNQMMDSEAEMVHILLENRVFSGKDEKALLKLVEHLRRQHVAMLEKYQRALAFSREWDLCVCKKISPTSFFEKRNIKNIGIYGAGIYGRNIEIVLKTSGLINVVCYIDKNAEYIHEEIPAYDMYNVPGKLDAVLLTLKDSLLKKELQEQLHCPIYYPEEIWES